jgi:LuxR family maltose regulon positive regulatory protein
MPKSAGYMLVWSSSNQAYELYEGQGGDALDMIPGTPVWSEWVSQIPSFAFRGQNGSYTARQERKQRGGGYWYAYARVAGKLTKHYLGRGADLTLARLEQVAQDFQPDLQAALHQQEGRASSRPRSVLSTALGENVFLPDYLSDAVTSLPEGTGHRHFRIDHLHASARLEGRRDNEVDGQETEYESGVDNHKTRMLPADTLLATKLHLPRTRPHLVYRPHLIQRLQQGLDKTLILLSAPAGFGKSTLLGDWLASCASPVAWLSLEPRDNDPRRFLAYLLAALRTSDPHMDKIVQTLPHLLQHASLESVLTRLINGLQTEMAGSYEHVVLVLDDYHVITNGSIHYALSFLMEHLPPHLHLVLATREDPPLPLARLRGRDDLLELRASDLRFTHEETATYLVEMMGLSLSAEERALLQARTEGWITGLHLMALSLQGCDDPASFIATFSGSHHYVADYLLDEVLNRQPQAIQDFLVQTSLLDRLSAPLCDAVRAHNDSQAQLGFLEQANLFLVPLDDERHWYRYHHLFAEALRQRLLQTAPTLVPDLHQRASRWFEQHGMFAEAISHALAASAFDEAAGLIEQYAWTFVMKNQKRTVYEQLHTLPETLILAHPSLRLLYASMLMNTQSLTESSMHLQAIEQELSIAEDARKVPGRLLLGQVMVCRSLLARLCGELEQCVALSQRALDLLPETEDAPLIRLLRGEALLGAAHFYLVSGNVTAASERVLLELSAFAHTSGDDLLALNGLNLLARLQVLQGRLHRAVATYEEIVQVIPGPEESNALLDNPTYHFGVSDLLREWNELEAAEQHLARGMDLLSDPLAVDADTAWLGYATQARLEMARGRAEQALATLDGFERLAQQRHFAPVLLAQCAALRVQLEMARGHHQAARSWAESSGLSANDVLSYLREREYLTLARVHIAEERVGPTGTGLSAILFLLERLISEAEANMRLHSVLEGLVLLALAFEVQGDRTEALVTLSRLLALAEPEGYLRLFLDEGPPMLALLHLAQQQSLIPGYVAKILAAASKTRSADFHHQAPQCSSLMEPLTARERDVLRLVLEGASNREIALQLILSVNTVKKHVLNIYGKLNVQNRAQAIAKARMLHLL